MSEVGFELSVDQMYGPLTTKRRGMALHLRKQLKEQGVIAGGYVEFPARLFVNLTGNVNADGKKIYTFHTDFSKQAIPNGI